MDTLTFLSDSKTERACVKNAIALAKSYGYRDIKEVIENKEILKAQDKVYVNMMNKSIALMHIGSNPLEKGMNILGAHIDSPRLDLKQNPLYEDGNLAYFRYSLLWWSQKISMGYFAFGYSWCCLFKRWNNC